jgi:uncharacterized membrane protein YwzB
MDIALILHISAGFTALFAGTLVQLFKKGTLTHRRLGLVFYYAMLMTGASALWLAFIRESEFLFCIGVFALYQTLSGKRAIENKSLNPTWLDYFLSFIAFANGVYMIFTLNIVLVVFGALCTSLAVQDGWLYLKLRRGKELEKNAWLRKHIGMMMGSYIATFTAFLVVNINDFEPAWLLWLSPTFVFVPVMSVYQRKYTRQNASSGAQSL